MASAFRYRGRTFTEAEIAFIRKLIAEHPGASRRTLSKQLCAAWNWVQKNGAPRDMVCRGLMLKLHREGQIALPAKKKSPPNPLARRGRRGVLASAAELPLFSGRMEERPTAEQPLCGPLGALLPLTFEQVRHSARETLFAELLERYHYLGYTQPVGEHLKYLVSARGQAVACLAWSSAPRHLSPRDEYIGWSKEARQRNIHLLAYNLRFLILPWVRAPHLASHLLGRMAKMLSGDWERVYGHPLYFLETFVDSARFRGTCYRAANWVRLGLTTGRGKDDILHRGSNRPAKDVYGYALCADFRERLAVL